MSNGHKQLIRNHFKMFKWRRVWEGSEGHVTDCKVLQLEIITAYQLGACILGLFGGQWKLHDLGQVMKLGLKLSSAERKLKEVPEVFLL